MCVKFAERVLFNAVFNTLDCKVMPDFAMICRETVRRVSGRHNQGMP